MNFENEYAKFIYKIVNDEVNKRRKILSICSSRKENNLILLEKALKDYKTARRSLLFLQLFFLNNGIDEFE